MPSHTPGASSPGMPSLRLSQAPGAANTALNPDSRRAAGSATRVPVFASTPRSRMCWISVSSVSLGRR